MKKFFTLLASGLFAAATIAQTCTPGNLQQPSFEPKPDSIACFIVGQPVDQTFYFRIPNTAGAFTIQYIRIDSVTNLPKGLTYQLNKANGTYNGGENGCVKLTGTPTGTAGQFRLGINVAVKTTAIPQELKGDMVEVANSVTPGSGDQYLLWVRVKADNAAGCPCIDTMVTKKDSVKVYNGTETDCPNFQTGISNINSAVSALTIVPNPFNSNATVQFTAEIAGTYTSRITNLLGNEVMRKTENVVIGNNNININRNELPAGVYFFSLSNGKGLVTKRFIIE